MEPYSDLLKFSEIILTIIIFHSRTNGHLSDGHHRNHCNYTKSVWESAGSVVGKYLSLF